LANRLERPGRDAFVHGIALLAWIHDPEMIEREVLESGAHRSRRGGRVTELHLHAVSPAIDDEEEVELRAAVGAPVVRLRRPDGREHLLDGEPFPRGPNSGMSLERPSVVQIQQAVQDP